MPEAGDPAVNAAPPRCCWSVSALEAGSRASPEAVVSWSQWSHRWLPKLGHRESIYTMEIGKHYKSELFSSQELLNHQASAYREANTCKFALHIQAD